MTCSGHQDHRGHGHHHDHAAHGRRDDHDDVAASALHEGPLPVVFTWRRELSLDGTGSQVTGQIVRSVRSFLAAMLPALRDRGCSLIGHVKGMVDAADAGRVFFSVTSFDGEPSITGELVQPIERCLLTLNVIVFGGDEQRVGDAVVQAADGHLGPWRVSPD